MEFEHEGNYKDLNYYFKNVVNFFFFFFFFFGFRKLQTQVWLIDSLDCIIIMYIVNKSSKILSKFKDISVAEIAKLKFSYYTTLFI